MNRKRDIRPKGRMSSIESRHLQGNARDENRASLEMFRKSVSNLVDIPNLAVHRRAPSAGFRANCTRQSKVRRREAHDGFLDRKMGTAVWARRRRTFTIRRFQVSEGFCLRPFDVSFTTRKSPATNRCLLVSML
jgi:hypothetical protein